MVSFWNNNGNESVTQNILAREKAAPLVTQVRISVCHQKIRRNRENSGSRSWRRPKGRWTCWRRPSEIKSGIVFIILLFCIIWFLFWHNFLMNENYQHKAFRCLYTSLYFFALYVILIFATKKEQECEFALQIYKSNIFLWYFMALIRQLFLECNNPLQRNPFYDCCKAPICLFVSVKMFILRSFFLAICIA